MPADDKHVIVTPDVDRNAEGRKVGRALVDRQAGAADQLRAVFKAALTEGLAQTLATELSELTLSDGPWLLYADGTVTEP